eukprot:6769740-Prymnesium_polylepis.1
MPGSLPPSRHRSHRVVLRPRARANAGGRDHNECADAGAAATLAARDSGAAWSVCCAWAAGSARSHDCALSHCKRCCDVLWRGCRRRGTARAP